MWNLSNLGYTQAHKSIFEIRVTIFYYKDVWNFRPLSILPWIWVIVQILSASSKPPFSTQL